MIVRWGLEELGPLLVELGIRHPMLVTSERLADLEVPVEARFTGVRRHAPTRTVAAAVEASGVADGLVAAGGGSAIDTGKAVSAQRGLALVAVPTTYAGAEWTSYYGMRDEEQRVKSGGGGANVAGVIYEPRLTLGLPRQETVGTALNALAHAAEALYVSGDTVRALHNALPGAGLIGYWLPRVVDQPDELDGRTGLQEGALHAGRALSLTGLALAHALAQVLGGRYDLPHGAMNALTLPPVLRFNEPAAGQALEFLREALDADDAARRVEELARLGGFERLRDFGVPEAELEVVAEQAAARPGARNNPRPAEPDEVLSLLREIW